MLPLFLKRQSIFSCTKAMRSRNGLPRKIKYVCVKNKQTRMLKMMCVLMTTMNHQLMMMKTLAQVVLIGCWRIMTMDENVIVFF